MQPRAIGLAFAVLTALLFASAAQAGPAPDPQLDKAKSLYDAGSFKEARLVLEGLVQKSPEDGVLRHQLGVCYEMSGDTAKGKEARLAALPKLEKAAAAPVPSIQVLYYLAGDYQLAGSQDKAKESIDRVAKLHGEKKVVPANAFEKYQLATMLDRAEKTPESIAMFSDALEGFRAEKSPNKRYFSDTLVRLGNVDVDAKHLDAAIAKFDEAQKVDPGNAGAFYVKGVVLDGIASMSAQQGKKDEATKATVEAEAQYQKAVAIEPRHFYAQFNLAHLLARQQKGEEALAALKAALAAEPSGTDLEKTYMALAQLCETLGKDRQASDYYARWGKLRPNPAAEMSSQYALAHALRREGNIDEATKTLKQLAQKAPDYPPLRAELADILLEQRKNDEAITELVATIGLLKTDEERGPIYLALGRAYREIGKASDAEAAFRKALGSSHSKAEAEKELSGKGTPPTPAPTVVPTAAMPGISIKGK